MSEELPKWRRAFMTNPHETWETNQAAADEYEAAKYGTPVARCPACGRLESIIWVHGHGQCAYCRTNIAPCCDGETCESNS